MKAYFYTEEQRFHQPWIWLGLGVAVLSLIPLWYGLYVQLVEGVPWGDRPSSDEVLALTVIGTTVVILGITVVFFNARLVVSIDAEGLDYRFIPFHRRVHTIPWSEVSRVYLRTYRPILEYGGWGIRFGTGGKAYNVSGTDGLQLELKTGKKILIGTRNPVEIGAMLHQIPVN